jgi:hypothetical protein
MSQILHIFKKDTRRFWPEILLSVIVTAAFALAYPVQWQPSDGGRIRQLQILANVLTVLVPVSWWLLIGRVVHAESLVGDRQFWLTRPYEWKKLLSSKLLFILVWLYLPFFAAQSVLLAEAGFRPFAFIPGLLFGLLLTTGILILPLFSIAVVTANFARMTLTLLGALIVFMIAAFAAALADRSGASIPSSDRISLPLILGLCAGAIALQYATRRVWRARILLIAALVLVAGIQLALSMSENSQVNRYYPPPVSASAAPFQLQLAPDPIRQVAGGLMEADDRRDVEIPLLVEGVADGFVIQIDNVRATITGADGTSWTSAWQAIYNHRLQPGSDRTMIDVGIDRAVYQRLQSQPVTVRLSLALTRLRAGTVTKIVMSAGDIRVPEFGICSESPNMEFRNDSISLYCRSALHQPELAHVSVLWSDQPCSSTQPTLDHRALADSWAGDLNPDPAEFGITSVWTPYLYFINASFHNGMPDVGSKHWRLCPGSPLTVTQYRLVDRTQMNLTLQNIILPIRAAASYTFVK